MACSRRQLRRRGGRSPDGVRDRPEERIAVRLVHRACALAGLAHASEATVDLVGRHAASGDVSENGGDPELRGQAGPLQWWTSRAAP